MKIHILTLSWQGIDKLQTLREGLCRNLIRITHKNGKLKEGFDHSTWYIRDNGSTDKTVDIVNSWNYLSDYQVENKCFAIGHNRDNFAKGVNFLFNQANPADDDLILLLNNDVIFNDSDSLQNMLNLLQSNKNIGVVGARLLYTNTSKLQHAGVIFSKQYGNLAWHFRRGEESDVNAKKNRYFQAITAAVCLVRASDFKKVGGLSEELSWAFDDVDFCLKVGQNKKIAYCGKTNIFHEESSSLKKNPVNKLFMNQNVSYFKKKWSGRYDIDHDKYLKDPDYNVIKG